MNKRVMQSRRPDWGKRDVETPAGGVQYFCGSNHDDQWTLSKATCVVNLSYDETSVAVDSDRYRPMRTPKDCVVIVPKGCSVSEKAKGNSDGILFDIKPEIEDRLLKELAPKTSPQLHFRDDVIDVRVGDIARAIRLVLISAVAADKLLIESLLLRLQETAIAAFYKKDLPDSKTHAPLCASTTLRVYEYIDSHLGDTITLNDMAALANLSSFHFTRAFKRTTGDSPYQAVINMRLVRARQYLLENKLPLVDIAIQTGFSSQAHMSEVFRRALRVTPGLYRRVLTD